MSLSGWVIDKNPRPRGYKQLQETQGMNYSCSYLPPVLYVDIVNNIVLYDIYRINPENEGEILRQTLCLLDRASS